MVPQTLSFRNTRSRIFCTGLRNRVRDKNLLQFPKGNSLTQPRTAIATLGIVFKYPKPQRGFNPCLNLSPASMCIPSFPPKTDFRFCPILVFAGMFTLFPGESPRDKIARLFWSAVFSLQSFRNVSCTLRNFDRDVVGEDSQDRGAGRVEKFGPYPGPELSAAKGPLAAGDRQVGSSSHRTGNAHSGRRVDRIGKQAF